LVRVAQTLLQRSAALIQTLLHAFGRALWVGGQIDGQFGFNLLRCVQLDDTLRLVDNASGQSMMLPGQVPGDVLLSAIDMLTAQDPK